MLAAFAQDISRDTLGDTGCGFVNRIPCQIGIARRGLDPGVVQEFSDHGAVEKVRIL